MNQELLCVENLSVSFPSSRGQGVNVVVDRISFSVHEDKFVGLVGESGSGKTVSALSVMQLLRPPGRIEGGKIWFKGENLLKKSENDLRKIRGRQIAMVFQSLGGFLNPLKLVGEQMARAYGLGRGKRKEELKELVAEMLRRVGMSDVKRVMRSYPHQLSGGMCQRVMIAMMISREPDLLIADEPTTGLDVTLQAQIFELVKEIRRQMRMSVLLITHDLGVLAETCEQVIVMHGGHVVEIGTTEQIFDDVKHPYTHRLLDSVLRVDKVVAFPDLPRLISEEIVFSLSGCRYRPKCERAMEICVTSRPEMVDLGENHKVMCHLYG